MPENAPKPSFFKILLSTLGAAIGVQNTSRLEEDFSQTNPLPYIVAGVIFTILFVVVLAGIVKLVISGTAA